MEGITLLHGDCLDLLPTIPDHSIDAIITDPPYGTTACKWDTVIPFVDMWRELRRIIKPRGAIVLFASQPFTSALVMSNPKWFKYQWVWDKVLSGAPLNARIMPLTRHEDIAVFGDGRLTYNPQMQPRKDARVNKGSGKSYGGNGSSPYGERKILDGEYTERMPTSVLTISNANRTNKLHPTQKPVPLLEYLIRTYTNEGETVLDFTFGSGSTAIACINTGRQFIGIERDDHYFQVASDRIANHQPPLVTV